MTKIIVANWKMNPISLQKAEKLFLDIVNYSNFNKKSASRVLKKVKVVIAPPFLYLEKLKNLIDKINRKNNTKILKILLGAQDIANISQKDMGPFTGEISALMLKNIGVSFVILGHSERRDLGESNLIINKKIKAALEANITPLLCVGERERSNSNSNNEHVYLNFIANQLIECLSGISKNNLSKIIIAYEPIWSISSTPNCVEAKPSDCYEMIVFIKKNLSDISSPQIASKIKIFYGGSVNKKNFKSFLKEGKADGLLVGSSSLKAEDFSEIIQYE